MTAPRVDRPEVVFALPGEWVRAALDDDREVEGLFRLLDDVVDDPTSFLAGMTAVGGVLMTFRIRSEPAVAMLIAWPPGEESGDRSLAGLRDRLGVEGDAIDHEAGYACVRQRSRTGAGDGEVLTYGVVHPGSGRLLLVRVTAFDGTFDELDVDDYDFCVSHLWWEEPDA